VDEVLADLHRWWSAGQAVGVGTVVGTWRSAPRQPGAAMLVGPAGEVVGSVSGGCVEGAVHELATEVLASGQPALRRFGVSDDDAFAVGLACGGILDVFVERVDATAYPELGDVVADVAAGRPVAVCTLLAHPDADRVGARLVVRPGTDAVGGLGDPALDAVVAEDAAGLLATGTSTGVVYGPRGERRGEGARVFVAAHAPRPRLLVFGAIDFAAALARLGTFLGYRVTVCDARAVFATSSRFPGVDEVVVRWPHRYLAEERDAGRLDDRTVVAVLTHDPKFDVPLLEVALDLPDLAYVGAMGSRRTHSDRLARLREAGLGDAQLARLSSPIGLDLGARTPEETAVAIAAEIVQLRWGGSGDRLSDTDGPLHGGVDRGEPPPEP
jgi:xanthine dehydrogenase accessory factor